MINLDATRRATFFQGFYRGLAAPMLLYAGHELPQYAMPQAIEVPNPARSTRGIEGDWAMVGKQLKAAMDAQSAHG